MWCEACGGDGLIEVGAYRGDEGSETRECRLCGGTATAPLVSSLGQLGVSAEGAAQALGKLSQTGLTLKESTSGVRRTVGVLVIDEAQDWAKRHAAEWDEKLRRENERQQRETERKRQALELKIIATCWYRGPEDSADTLRHCREIESTELVDGIAQFKPAESDERVTHVKICAAQKSGSCIFPLASEVFVAEGNTLTLKLKPDEMQTIISTFVK